MMSATSVPFRQTYEFPTKIELAIVWPFAVWTIVSPLKSLWG